MVYSKIGIRPVIDGRWGGVREGLETQTMNMAKAAAALISGNLKYSDGTPVQCVIADSTIGERRWKNRQKRRKICRGKCDGDLDACWCYGSETMDLDPNTIKAVWGFNGTERPGAVYLAAVLAAHAQKKLPPFPSMATTYRMQAIPAFPATLRRRSFALHGAPSQ